MAALSLMRRFLLLSLLFASALAFLPSSLHSGPTRAWAQPTPSFTLLADFNGWNFTQPSGTNPTIQSALLFAREQFSVTVRWVNNQHNLAIYQPGTLSTEIDLFDGKDCSMTPKCVAESDTVSLSPQQTVLTTAIATAGVYEYYCEFHTNMHGKFKINRSPDINTDTFVNIIDLAIVGAAFGSTPTSANWNPNADLNLDSTINIIDLALVAISFGRTVP